MTYWAADHDTCTAECSAEWLLDDESRIEVWDLFEHGPEPVGYDPAIIPPWSGGPTSEAFAALRLHAVAPAGHARHGHDRRPGRAAHLAGAQSTT